MSMMKSRNTQTVRAQRNLSLLLRTLSSSPSASGGAVRLMLMKREGEIHREMQQQRWISATTAVLSDDAIDSGESQTDLQKQQQKERYRRISKFLYRQMIRWCQNVLRLGFPEDIISYYVPTKKRYDAPQQIDPYRMKALREVLAAAQAAESTPLQKILREEYKLTDPNQKDDETVRIINRVLNLMPIRHVVCDPTSLHITLSHLTVSEMMNFIRAIFHINHVPIPDLILDGGDVLYQQLMSYEKQRRTMAFDEMKQLNENVGRFTNITTRTQDTYTA
jgi:hypothetical protein